MALEKISINQHEMWITIYPYSLVYKVFRQFYTDKIYLLITLLTGCWVVDNARTSLLIEKKQV